MELVRSGKMKILFVAPERLNNEGDYQSSSLLFVFRFTNNPRFHGYHDEFEKRRFPHSYRRGTLHFRGMLFMSVASKILIYTVGACFQTRLPKGR